MYFTYYYLNFNIKSPDESISFSSVNSGILSNSRIRSNNRRLADIVVVVGLAVVAIIDAILDFFAGVAFTLLNETMKVIKNEKKEKQ